MLTKYCDKSQKSAQALLPNIDKHHIQQDITVIKADLCSNSIQIEKAQQNWHLGLPAS